MHAGWRGQGGETGEEIERREGEGSDVVLPGTLEVHGNSAALRLARWARVAVRELAEPIGGDDGAGEVPEQTLEGLSCVGRDGDAGMDVEAARAPGREGLFRTAG